jgi:hypothetical protein
MGGCWPPKSRNRPSRNWSTESTDRCPGQFTTAVKSQAVPIKPKDQS